MANNPLFGGTPLEPDAPRGPKFGGIPLDGPRFGGIPVERPLSNDEARLSDEMDEVSAFEIARRSLGRGMTGLAEAAGAGLQYAGNRLGKPGLTEFGETYAETARDISGSFPRTEALQGSILEKPGLLLDPKWWAEVAPEMVPSLAAAVVPAIGGARVLNLAGKAVPFTAKHAKKIAALGGALIGGGVGGALEGSSTYQYLLEQGYPESEAARAAEYMTGMTAILNAVPLARITGGAHKGIAGRAGTGLAEAITEWLEGPAKEVAITTATGEDLTLQGLTEAAKEEANVAPPAFLVGALMPGSGIGRPRQERKPRSEPRLSPDAERAFDEAMGTAPEAERGVEEAEELTPEEVDLAPAPESEPMVEATAELAEAVRPAPPASNVEVTEGKLPVEEIEGAPPPSEPPPGGGPIPSAIDVAEFDIEEIAAAPPPAARLLPPPAKTGVYMVSPQGEAKELSSDELRALTPEARKDAIRLPAEYLRGIDLASDVARAPQTKADKPGFVRRSENIPEAEPERDPFASRDSQQQREAVVEDLRNEPPEPGAKLPKNFPDDRLLRPGYRNGLGALAGELIFDGGGMQLIGGNFTQPELSAADKQDDPTRLPSLNPDWFKGMAATEKAEGSSITVKQVQTAVNVALKGGPLGKRQRRVIEAMLGEVEDRVAQDQAMISDPWGMANTDAAAELPEEDADAAAELLDQARAVVDEDALDAAIERVAQQHEGAGTEEYNEALSRELRRLIDEAEDRQTTSRATEEGTPSDRQSPEQVRRGEEAAQAEAEALLTPYTAEDLQAREDQNKEAERKRVEAERKAEADAGVDSFVLAGSEREADEGMARGQEDLTTVETRESVMQGQPLFKREEQASESRRKGLSAPATRSYLEAKVGKPAIKRLIDSGAFRIIDTADALPADAKARMAEGDVVYGYHDPSTGVSYLVAENLTDRPSNGVQDNAYGIFLHELGVHYGMREILGDKLFDDVIERVNAAKSGPLAEAVKRAREAVHPDTDPSQVGEETLANLVADRANHEMSLIRRVIAKIRAWLVQHGFTKAADADALVMLARGAALRAGGKTVTSRDPMFKARSTATMHPATDEERKHFVHPIPPAWIDVMVTDDLSSDVWVTGRDKRGNPVSISNPEHTAAALEEKFERQRRFDQVFKDLTAQIYDDADRGVEEAAVLRLIARTGFRVGGARQRGVAPAFGASTLRVEHVQIDGDTISFDFPGKRGKRQEHSITDPGLAEDLRQRISDTGSGKIFNTNDDKIRSYLKGLSDGDFIVHDFRTWNATDAARQAIEASEAPSTPEEFWKAYLKIGDVAAQKIGDTRLVALESYVDPQVFAEWRQHAGVEPDATRPKRARKSAQTPAPTPGADQADARVLRKPPLEQAPEGKAGEQIGLFARRNPAAQRIVQRGEAARGRVNTWLKRNFTKEGLMNSPAFELKLRADAVKNVGEEEIGYAIHALESAVKKAYGKSYNDLSEAQLSAINDQLHGVEQADLSASVREATAHMRDHLDMLSGRLIVSLEELLQLRVDSLGDKQREQYALALNTNGEEGVIPESIAPLLTMMETISGNIGSYVHRSYQAFDDPKWKATALADKDLMAEASAYIQEQNEDLDPGEVMGAIRGILQDAADNGNFMNLIAKGTKVGSKDVSVLKRRKDVPEIIRRLLGEYHDPKVNFARSASKMQWLLANHYFLTRLRKQGLGDFLFQRRTGEHDALIATPGSSVMNPLDGLYTTVEFRQGMEDALDKFDGSDLMRQLIRGNSIIKYGKTVASPTTQMRNFQSAAMFTIMNGHFDWSHMATSFRATKSDLFTKDETWRAYLNDLIDLGVIHNNPYAGELRDALRDMSDMDIYVKGPLQMTKRTLHFMRNLYQVGDDFWKIIGYENELNNQRAAGKTEKQAKAIAAYRIRNGYPTYSMVPRGIKKLRRWPLIGTFVSFPYEIIRTTYNQAQFIREDWKGNRPAAVRRILGFSIASSAAYAASVISMALLGLDDEDDEAVRAQGPEWSRNSQLIYTGYDEDGLPRYIDISYTDPYTYIKKPLSALMNGNTEGWDGKLVDAMTEFAEPFIGTDIAAGTILEVWSNKKSRTGGPVYNPEDEPMRRAQDIVQHIRRSVQPGMVSNVERTIQAIADTPASSAAGSLYGKEKKLSDEGMAWLGVRVSTLNLAQSLVYRSYGFSDEKRLATRILSRAAGDPGRVDESDLQGAVESMGKARERAYRKMIRQVQGARKLGMSDNDIVMSMRAARVSKEDIGAILAGRVPPWRMSRQFMQSVEERAYVSAPSQERKRQIRKTIAERRQVVARLLSEQRAEMR